MRRLLFSILLLTAFQANAADRINNAKFYGAATFNPGSSIDFANASVFNLPNPGGLPVQAGHNGQFLITDGVTTSWSSVSFLSLVDKPTSLAGYGITDGALNSAVVHNAGNESIAGIKTFSSPPAVPDNSFAESKVINLVTDLAAKALDSAAVHKTGNETVAGVKTFSSAPILSAATASTVAYIDSSKNLVSAPSILVFAPGVTVVYHANGTSTVYTPASNTDTARGVALSSAFAAAVAGERIDIGPDTYQIAAPLTILTGQKVYGHSTKIKLSDQGAGSFGGVGKSIIQDTAGTLDGLEVHDLLFDCNLHNQSATNSITQAVRLDGTNVLIENCRAINWGSKDVAKECFVFFAANNVSVNGASIINCTVDTPAPVVQAGGTTAFLSAWKITGCSVHDVTVGTGSGQPAYFHGYSVYNAQGGLITNNTAYNLLPYTKASIAVYTDTGNNSGLLVSGNTFTNVNYGVSVQVADGYAVSDLNITNNHISALQYAVALATFGSGSITNARITNNPQLVVVPAANGHALNVAGVTNLVVENNCLDSIDSQIVDNGGNTNVQQRDNHKIDGTVVVSDFAPTVKTIVEGGTNSPTSLGAIQNLTTKGTDIAAASTTNLALATGPFLNITGNTTINSFGTLPYGIRFGLRFTGTPVITYNASSMILPGSSSITAQVGDTAVFESLGSGNWQCLVYNKINGKPLVDNTVGTVTNTGGNLTSNALVIGNGTADEKVVLGLTTDGISKITLGVAGTSVGSIDFHNAVSGTQTLRPSTGNILAGDVVLPTGAGTLATLSDTTSATAAYAAGTVYSMTASDALVHFGTTDPTLVLPSTAGTYLLFGRAYLRYNGATYAGTQTATVHLRRTNNTAADIANATTTATMRVITTITDSVGIMELPPVKYTATGSGSADSISVYGSVSATPAAGSVDVTEASIMAIKIAQ